MGQRFPVRLSGYVNPWDSVFLFGRKGLIKCGSYYMTSIRTVSINPPHSGCQKGDMKHSPRWQLTVLVWPVKLSVIWRFLLSMCEMMHFFVCNEERNCNNCADNIRHHHPKFSWPGAQGLCTVVIRIFLFWALFFAKSKILSITVSNWHHFFSWC